MTYPLDEGWLQRQVEKSAATLAPLPAEIREQLTHRTSQDALRAARSASEQSRDTAVRAEVIMLRDENAHLRFKLSRTEEALEDERVELADMRRKFDASQLLADQAIKERDAMQVIVRERNREINESRDSVRARWAEIHALEAELADMTEQRDRALCERDTARAQVSF